MRENGLNLFEYSITSNLFLENFSGHKYTEHIEDFDSFDYQ